MIYPKYIYVVVSRLYSNLSLLKGSSYRKGKFEVTCEVRGLPSPIQGDSSIVFGWFKELSSDR